MSGVFSKPKMPPPPKPIEMPKTPVVDQAALNREQADMLRRRKGRAATIMSDSSGDVGSGSVATKSLLGG
jgi:hypothetical protein